MAAGVVSQSIQYSAASAINTNQNYSFAMWVYPISYTNLGSRFFSKDGHVLFRYDTNGGTGIKNHLWNGTHIRQQIATAPSTGSWHHFVFQTTTTDCYKIWIDGADVGGTPFDLTTASQNLNVGVSIGSASEGGSNHIQAETAVWNVLLDSGDIASLAKGLSPLFIRRSNLKWYTSLLRNFNEIISGMPAVGVSATVATHPKIYYPSSFH